MKQIIEIPESINDIQLWRWQKYMSIVKEDSDNEFVNRKALEIYYGIEGRHYDSLKVKDIEHIMKGLVDALGQKPTLVRRFVLSDVEYGFIPNLDDITFGEFVDLDKYNNTKDFHKLMSILYRPIKKTKRDKYKIEPYNGSNERLAGMSLGIAQSAAAFFFDIGLQLTRNILKSSKVGAIHQKKKLGLALNGIGFLLSTPYQMEIFLNSKK